MLRTQQPPRGATARPSSAPAPRIRRRAALLAASMATAAALVAGGAVSAQAIETHHVVASTQRAVPAASPALDPPAAPGAADSATDPLRTSAFRLGFNVHDLVYVILSRQEQDVIIAALATGASQAICGRLRAFCGRVGEFILERVIGGLVEPCAGDWKYDLLLPPRSHCM